MTRLDEILTAGEVAADLRCSRAHVYKLLHGRVAGVSRLPAIFLGRKMLVRRGTLERWKGENEMSDGGAKLSASSKVDAVDA